MGTVGTPNTGGGGGGNYYTGVQPYGMAGGSGVVIIRYPGPQKATGGTITTNNSYTIHTFTTSGTFTPGANWADTSGNNIVGTLTNGPTYSSANGGSIVFDGVNDYGSIASPGSYSEYTFILFCKWIAATTYDRLFGLNNFGTYTIFTPANVAFHYNPLGGIPGSVVLNSGVNIGYGTWCQVAVTVSAASNLVTIYINGTSRNSWATLPSNNFGGSIFLGSQNGGVTMANCNIGSFALYSRALSAGEVAQNFNATRSRYGL
jgi:hypothetical protein